MTSDKKFLPLRIALLTVSDSRTLEQDSSGAALQERLQNAGHELAERRLLPDDRYRIRALVANWIADPQVNIVIISGGTGFTGRDNTPEAISPLFDKSIEGFGELFRQLSFEEIGTSTIQSRALAGLSNGTLVFAVPGSTNACLTAWDRILGAQLDSRTGPCNFVALLKRFTENPDHPAR